MNIRNYTCWGITCFMLFAFVNTASANVSLVREPSNIIENQNNDQSTDGTKAAYVGSIKVHIVEPVSRWNDLTGNAYDNAHLVYPMVTDLNIADATIWDTTITWDGSTSGFSNLSSENIGTVVAIFTSAFEICDAYPPNSYYYYAYYADASASARPNQPGMNRTSAGFTHSVYIEEGTATW